MPSPGTLKSVSLRVRHCEQPGFFRSRPPPKGYRARRPKPVQPVTVKRASTEPHTALRGAWGDELGQSLVALQLCAVVCGRPRERLRGAERVKRALKLPPALRGEPPRRLRELVADFCWRSPTPHGFATREGGQEIRGKSRRYGHARNTGAQAARATTQSNAAQHVCTKQEVIAIRTPGKPRSPAPAFTE
jgi:hypothetical protein